MNKTYASGGDIPTPPKKPPMKVAEKKKSPKK